jgi:hypothetical protein
MATGLEYGLREIIEHLLNSKTKSLVLGILPPIKLNQFLLDGTLLGVLTMDWKYYKQLAKEEEYES